MKCTGCHRETEKTKPVKMFASLLYLCSSCLDIVEAMRKAEEERKFRENKRKEEKS